MRSTHTTIDLLLSRSSKRRPQKLFVSSVVLLTFKCTSFSSVFKFSGYLNFALIGHLNAVMTFSFPYSIFTRKKNQYLLYVLVDNDEGIIFG